MQQSQISPVDPASSNDKRQNALIDTLSRLLKESEDPQLAEKLTRAFGSDLQKIFDDGGLLSLLNRDQLSTFVPGIGFHLEGPIRHIIEHILHYPEHEDMQRSVFRALASPPLSIKDCLTEEASLLNEGLMHLTRLQNHGQQYHTILHALERQTGYGAFLPDRRKK